MHIYFILSLPPPSLLPYSLSPLSFPLPPYLTFSSYPATLCPSILPPLPCFATSLSTPPSPPLSYHQHLGRWGMKARREREYKGEGGKMREVEKRRGSKKVEEEEGWIRSCDIDDVGTVQCTSCSITSPTHTHLSAPLLPLLLLHFPGTYTFINLTLPLFPHSLSQCVLTTCLLTSLPPSRHSTY